MAHQARRHRHPRGCLPGPAAARTAAAARGPSAGGSSGRGAQSGVAAALMALLTLVLLRLARGAADKPIWRSYLPEVPPA